MSTKTICKIDGCDKPVVARGWCRKHYSKWYKYGDPLKCLKTPNNTVMPFIESIIKSPPNECVEWPFSKFPCGYGQVDFNGKNRNAHRVTLILATGRDPKALFACHTCHNRSCINPDHLYWGTASQNMMDKVRDGTDNRGENHWDSKLTASQVRSIRKDNRLQRIIADDYGVKRKAISDIKTRKTWAWLRD